MSAYRNATVAAAFGAALFCAPAFAGDDLCRVGQGEWMSVAEISAKAEAAGYTVREVERDDGCYEIKGTGPDGGRVEVKMHPVTGEVVKVEIDD